jgi:hypothetical protein
MHGHRKKDSVKAYPLTQVWGEHVRSEQRKDRQEQNSRRNTRKGGKDRWKFAFRKWFAELSGVNSSWKQYSLRFKRLQEESGKRSCKRGIGEQRLRSSSR